MTENINDAPARIDQGPKISAIWIVPIVAVLIGIWMVYSHWTSQGPLIEITFETSEGIEVGKTKVKIKSIEIGQVLGHRFSEKAEHVVLSVRINKHEAHLLREDSKFWVIRPRIGKSGISGLNTLLSGAYIEMSPGSSEKSAKHFEGLELPPVTPIGTPGLHITLDSNGDTALAEGDPILFHGMQVGTIEYIHFNSNERRTYYNAFIEAPFDALITANTHFWFSSGLTIDISADGVHVDVASLTALIGGGVSFDVPENQPQGERITERAFFPIYPRKSKIHETRYTHSMTYVVLFEDSIRGLRAGAPVEYRGVKLGEVIRTDINYPEIDNLFKHTLKIPVLIKMEPARIGVADTKAELEGMDLQVKKLISHGLHGVLATGNLLTGQKYIELQSTSSATSLPKTFNETTGLPETFAGYTVIPSRNSQFNQMIADVGSVLKTIDQLPMDNIAQSLHKAMDEAAITLAAIHNLSTELKPILEDTATHELIGTLNTALTSFQSLALDFSEGAATNQELQQSLRSLEQTLKELGLVLRTVRRKPNSLIFGIDRKETLEPKGVQK